MNERDKPRVPYPHVERWLTTIGEDGKPLELMLTYANTLIFTFSEKYAEFNRLEVNKNDGRLVMYFKRPFAFVEELIELDYPRFHKPFPMPDEILQYEEYQRERLERELGRFGIDGLNE